MKHTFIKPPGGPGVSGSDLVPEYGSAECHARMKTVDVECQRDPDGTYFAINPFNGKRVNALQPKRDSFQFTRLPTP